MSSLRTGGPSMLTRVTRRTLQHQQTSRQRPIFRHEYRSLETKLRAQGSPEEAGSTRTGEILYLVLPLLLVYISNQWSRYSISYLVDFSTDGALNPFQAMNVELQFDQSQYGLLASTAFTILFALSSLLAGSLADKYDRKLLTMGSCGVWTLATLAQSQANTYNDVLVARIIMGGACAFAVPAAYTLISEKVSKDKLALANSFYGSGVYVGGALASLSLLLDNNYGWRTSLEAIAGFGFVSVAIAGLALPSDSFRKINGAGSEAKSQKEEGGLFSDASDILSIPRVQFIFLASFVRFCSGLLIGVWAAPYYKQAFPESSDQYALINAIIVGAIGMSSGILGGYVADSLGARVKDSQDSGSVLLRNFDESNIRLLLPIVGNLLAIPSWYLTMHSVGSEESFRGAMFWLAIEYLVAECWFGPTIAVLQSTVGKSRTGTAQGLFVLTGALGNLAPTLLGIIYSSNSQVGDGSGSSPEVLADYLTYGVCAGYLLSSIFFALSLGASSQSRGEQ